MVLEINFFAFTTLQWQNYGSCFFFAKFCFIFLRRNSGPYSCGEIPDHILMVKNVISPVAKLRLTITLSQLEHRDIVQRY